MDVKAEKCVIIVEDGMELGIAANVISILSISLGKLRPDIVGDNTPDKEGNTHIGLIQVPVPVLKATGDKINEIRNILLDETYSGVSCVDFTNVAQQCMTYVDYTETMASSDSNSLVYYGLALAGNKKKINKLTGSLGLLR